MVICFLKCPSDKNLFLQTLHSTVCSTQCILWWFLRYCTDVKLLLQSGHGCFFLLLWLSLLSAWCTLLCWFSRALCVKAFPHSPHLTGLSPRCSMTWCFKAHGWLNPLWHILHTKGLSPVCILVWRTQLALLLKHLLQKLHLKGCLPLWTIICCLKLFLYEKVLLQILQTQGCSGFLCMIYIGCQTVRYKTM